MLTFVSHMISSENIDNLDKTDSTGTSDILKKIISTHIK